MLAGTVALSLIFLSFIHSGLLLVLAGFFWRNAIDIRTCLFLNKQNQALVALNCCNTLDIMGRMVYRF